MITCEQINKFNTSDFLGIGKKKKKSAEQKIKDADTAGKIARAKLGLTEDAANTTQSSGGSKIGIIAGVIVVLIIVIVVIIKSRK